MNISKTNPLSNILIKKKAKLNLVSNEETNSTWIINNMTQDDFLEMNKNDFAYNGVTRFLDFYHKGKKVIRVTKNISENAKMINLDSIKNNMIDFKFINNRMIIMLHNDSNGIINIEKVGSDFNFCYIKNMTDVAKIFVNTYSFISNDFLYQDNIEECIFVVKLIAYLHLGSVTTKNMSPKTKVKINSFSKFVNDSNINITYADSLWKQRICVDGFKVRGHFRLQRFGESRKKQKLIWIEEFKKNGYNRKATIELQ